MKLALLYIYCVCEDYEAQADRFLKSYLRFDPGIDHDLVVCVNAPTGWQVNREYAARFKPVPVKIMAHDDTGWDIGAYLAFANSGLGRSYDAVVCCGGHCHFKRGGWLKRFVEAWTEFGPGAYGSLGSFEIRPHFCTTGFMTSPLLLRSWQKPIVTKEDRYAFEHGPESFHRMVSGMGFPVRLVTWDGVYSIRDWRKPANIYRRGDQSNCLTFSQHTETFAAANPYQRPGIEWLADNAAYLPFIEHERST